MYYCVKIIDYVFGNKQGSWALYIMMWHLVQRRLQVSAKPREKQEVARSKK